jgi:hypothetical protein
MTVLESGTIQEYTMRADERFGSSQCVVNPTRRERRRGVSER